MSLGVIIGRFQVPQLHEGHIALISAVAARCSRVMVLVGVSPSVANAHDPLPFFCRADSIKSVFPAAAVVPLMDQPNDQEWSEAVDIAVMATNFLQCPDEVTIFCGRDSSVPSHYSGILRVETIDLNLSVSGTEIRKASELGYSFDFRQGMVHASRLRFPVSFQTVDIAVRQGEMWLAGRKRSDGGLFRFPGGFVDPADASLESAAKRELREECGSSMEVGNLRYVASVRIDDWRYRDSTDKILTAFFTADHVFGPAQAHDDLDEVVWMTSERLAQVIHPVHRPLLERLTT